MNPRQNEKVLIPTFTSIEVIRYDYILYLEAFENYCRVHLTSGERYTSTYSFGALCTMLEEFPIYKIHKSYAVNLDHVKRYLKTYDVELVTGKVVPVARRRRDEFLNELRAWIMTEGSKRLM